MNKIATIILIVLFNSMNSKAQNRFTQIINPSEYSSETNDLNKINAYDFSALIEGLPVSYTYGVIGDKYKRIRIKIVSATKNNSNANLYHIKGKSKVGNNLEDFEGTILLQNIRQINDRLLDEPPISLSTKYQGVVSGIYTFSEPKNKTHSGVFEGKYQGLFQILEKDNKVYYNDLDLFRNSYINNVYEGTWTDYSTNKTKICKWGDFRVPNVSSDFDIGAGQFSPNSKYDDQGWKTYHEAFLNYDRNEKAMQIEEGVWWE